LPRSYRVYALQRWSRDGVMRQLASSPPENHERFQGDLLDPRS